MSDELAGPGAAANGNAKDFTKAHERITFRIDGDLFEAARALPGRVMTEFAKRFSDLGESPATDQLDVILEALSLVLLPESYARFDKRFGDLESPIELTQAVDVVMWLLEQYGMRPTQPSSGSASGPEVPASGTNSTDAQPQPEPTSPNSPPTGS